MGGYDSHCFYHISLYHNNRHFMAILIIIIIIILMGNMITILFTTIIIGGILLSLTIIGWNTNITILLPLLLYYHIIFILKCHKSVDQPAYPGLTKPWFPLSIAFGALPGVMACYKWEVESCQHVSSLQGYLSSLNEFIYIYI